MKGYLAMQKMDLICDEYIREAEIDTDTAVVVSEKGRFWRGFKHFMNSPVGVAMLCAVVSLSVLAAIVMAGTGKWGGWNPPAGSHAESESNDTAYEHDTQPPDGIEFTITYSKDHVAEFYQALQDKGMIDKIPDPAASGEFISSDDPIYLIGEEDIFNVTPAEIYEKTGAMIFDAHMIVYLWMDDEIYILNRQVIFGSGFVSAVLCDYDLNGTEDIFCSYITSLSGVWYTDFVVFDITEKALRHDLRYTQTTELLSGPIIVGSMVFCDLGLIHKRMQDGAAYYDIYLADKTYTNGSTTVYTARELYATLVPSADGLVYVSSGESSDPGETETEPLPPINEIPELVPTVLSQYLDAYGFVGVLSEGDFIHVVLGKFSYEGQPLNEMPIVSGSGELPDGGFTGTAFYQGDCKDFDFSHSSKFPADNNDSYAYYFRTQIPLDGFALPYGMVLGDTFDQALVKMVLEALPPFTPGATILYRVGGETLTVIREDTDTAFSYRLVFEETETSTVSEERDVTVTRKLTLSFGQDLKLFEVKVAVDTQYSTFTVQVTDIPELTPTVATEIKEAFFEQNVTEADQAFYSIDDLSIRYFGTYSGGFVVFVDGIFDYTTAFEYETVLGIEFEYSSGQKLLYYKDGRFYSLTEAAGAGLLSQADVQKLHEVYTN